MDAGDEVRRAWADEALAGLCFHWGAAYRFSCDAVAGWWQAARRDTGRVLVAPGPRELRALVVGDYSSWPVPRGVVAVPLGAVAGERPEGGR